MIFNSGVTDSTIVIKTKQNDKVIMVTINNYYLYIYNFYKPKI